MKTVEVFFAVSKRKNYAVWAAMMKFPPKTKVLTGYGLTVVAAMDELKYQVNEALKTKCELVYIEAPYPLLSQILSGIPPLSHNYSMQLNTPRTGKGKYK